MPSLAWAATLLQVTAGSGTLGSPPQRRIAYVPIRMWDQAPVATVRMLELLGFALGRVGHFDVSSRRSARMQPSCP
jgi:hypothetical protein